MAWTNRVDRRAPSHATNPYTRPECQILAGEEQGAMGKHRRVAHPIDPEGGNTVAPYNSRDRDRDKDRDTKKGLRQSESLARAPERLGSSP